MFNVNGYDSGETAGALLATGATGFVGAELLVRALERSGRHVYVLVRAGDDAAAQARIDAVLREALGVVPPDRVTAIAGDLEADGLGLTGRSAAMLAADVTTVLHCAASVSFSLPLARAREINVEGTRRMLALARGLPRLERFAYVSTAYVSGRHRGLFGADDLDCGQRFRNTYERSKHEAELLVGAAGRELPVQVFRPSIVVGERRTGWTSSFNVLYQPLRAFSRGHYSVLPGDLDAPVDIVPIDYVADGIWTLLQQPHDPPSRHMLVAGPAATTVGELSTIAASYFKLEPPRIVPPVAFNTVVAPVLKRVNGRMRAMIEDSEVFFPYFAIETEFDDPATRNILRRHGLRPASAPELLPQLLDYAVEAQWGKRERARHAVLAHAPAA